MKRICERVLIVDDNEDVLLAAKLLLKSYVKTIHTEQDPEVIPQLINSESYDVIFLDMNFTQDITSGQEGIFWLKEILKIDSSAVVILITAYGDVETAVKTIKEGATDFILKPWQNEKFLATFASAVKLRESRNELNLIRSRQKHLSADLDTKFHDIIGASSLMKEVFATIEKVAKTDANVLILGENGTGKELVARAIHRQSHRADDVFINVDMGAISSSLFESELFGHSKGAFTDAKENHTGRFETASGGTIFLDEISNLSLELQVKLLSVLQNRSISRVGSNKVIPIDIRLVCASNRDLNQMINENSFRQDLMYRINTVEIHIPPLRDRAEDILLLAEYFLEIYKRKYNKPRLTIGETAVKKILHHTWPGNVRELQHSIERCVILGESDILQPHDFFFSANEEIKKEKVTLDSYNLDEIEKEVIREVIKKNKGNITKAATDLGLTRTSLYRRMEKFGL
ncbi:MAG: sigma-54 dependent transcriptional regulator [Melioribacteraceae bacterium]|jgi:DNA-binding NtrC family response regulator|nr:sigma-54 dependent transcriptional regulator [Melioribacteraceae bacterium]